MAVLAACVCNSIELTGGQLAAGDPVGQLAGVLGKI
jgi:hypothetical protein